MKKILMALLISCSMMTLVSCGSNDSNEKEEQKIEVGQEKILEINAIEKKDGK